MRIFSRYVFRQALSATLLILLSLTGVVWIAVALRQLNLITSQGQDFWTFLKMTTLALPNLMALIAPIALVIAAIHTLNRLNGDSELIVLTAAGAPIWTVARPLLALGVLVMIGVTLVNHWIMPWSLRALRDAVIEVRTDLISQVIQPGRFSSPEQGLTFHIRDRSLTGELQGLMLNDQRDSKQVSTYLAERGVIVKQGEASYLYMERGHILRRPEPTAPADIIRFETYIVDLARFEKKDDNIELKPRERYFTELAFPSPDDPDFKRQPGHFRAELHERFASPLYPLAFIMLALAFVGQAQSNRQNRMEPVVFAFVAAAAVRLGGLAANNLVVLKAAWVPLLYAIPLVTIALTVLMIRRNARPRPGPSAWDRISLALEDVTAKLPRPRLRRLTPAGG